MSICAHVNGRTRGLDMNVMTTSLTDGFFLRERKERKKTLLVSHSRHCTSIPLCLLLSYSLVRSLSLSLYLYLSHSLSHSQAHRHIIVCFHKGERRNVSRGRAMCVCVLCSLAQINRYRRSGHKINEYMVYVGV